MNGHSVRLTAPSRLHFGLLGWGHASPRQFGSVGLMIEKPGLSIVAKPADAWTIEGSLAYRGGAIVDRILAHLNQEATHVLPLSLTIESAPPEHIGLGTGTQLSLAIARLILDSVGERNPSIERLAQITGRGLRSGIGLHGFSLGGLLVDGGRGLTSKYPPLLTRIALPTDWSILIVVPPVAAGLSDRLEREAFAQLPEIPLRTIEILSRLVLLHLLPAAAECNLAEFGSALGEIQRLVGGCFAPVQGGIFADTQLETIIVAMERLGLIGVGQSSWGPTLYGFIIADEHQRLTLAKRLKGQFLLPDTAVSWTRPSNHGTRLEPI